MTAMKWKYCINTDFFKTTIGKLKPYLDRSGLGLNKIYQLGRSGNMKMATDDMPSLPDDQKDGLSCKDAWNDMVKKPGKNVQTTGSAGIQLTDEKGAPQSYPFRAGLIGASEKGIFLTVTSDLEDAIFLLKGRDANVVVDSDSLPSSLDVFFHGHVTQVKKAKRNVYAIHIRCKQKSAELVDMVRQLRFSQTFEKAGNLGDPATTAVTNRVVGRRLDDTILGQLCLDTVKC